MAKSPENHDSSALADKYLLGWKATYRLLKEGRSWSGSERNCAFLNCGDGRYANISAVTGLDFSDDARGLAVTDWDHDGGLDLWLSNRTGPRLRLMRNRTDTPGRFVAFKLCGSSSNRDAIGSRVEVVLSEAKSNVRAENPKGEIATPNPVPASRILPLSNGHGSLIQTVYAGDGFVSQSTKWLHFGLPANAHIKGVTVRWPGGQTQKLTSIQAGRRYVVVENQSKPTEWHPPSREI